MNLLALLSNAVEDLAERAGRSVVAVEVGDGAGTGFSIGSGLVLTNAHVVRGRAAPIVRERGGAALPATIRGKDPQTDLAVLEVSALDAPSLMLSERRPRVGSLVVAIGNPLRFDRSVSLGVVSALDRQVPAGRRRMDGLVQHDAAINPGNSGGPLLDPEGQVVGINTARVPWADGIGFAVPATTARWVVDQLIARGAVNRPLLGITTESIVLGPRDIARTGLDRALRLKEVRGNTPAQRAGLKAGDLLIEAAGNPVGSVADLQRALVVGEPAKVGLRVLREGRRMELSVDVFRRGSRAAA